MVHAARGRLQTDSQLRGSRAERRSLICTQSSALRTFVHNNKFENHYKGQVTKLQVYETLDALQWKSRSAIYTIES